MSQIVDEYHQKLLIDRSSLDIMLETQADRYSWMVEMSAEADKAYREAERNIDVVSAQVYKALMATTENNKPMTGTNASRYLPGDPRVIKAKEVASQAQYEARILSGGVKAFEQRKTMLTKISERDDRDYYGGIKRKRSFEHEAEDALQEEDWSNRS